MLPKTLALVAFFFGIAVAQQSPPAPECTAFCCGTYIANSGPAFEALLGKGSAMPVGSFGTQCARGNCTTTDVAKKSGCCQYYAQFLGWTSGCDVVVAAPA